MRAILTGLAARRLTLTDGPIGAEMRFNLLGTLGIVASPGERIFIARPRLRQLMTVLLLMKNRRVSSGFLVRAV